MNTISSEAWVAHASRVWATASSPSRTFSFETAARGNARLKDRFGETPKPARETRALPKPATFHAFTIMELLVVLTIILVLAGLILATSGYVQNKSKRSRAETEIAALTAALENYKADNGSYPIDAVNGTTNTLDARTMLNPTAFQYAAASVFLYKELSGDPIGNRAPTGKSHFPFKPTMLLPKDQATAVIAVADPFGNSYGYSTANQTNPSKGYNPTFDLWSTAGTGTGPTPNPSPQGQWIKNW